MTKAKKSIKIFSVNQMCCYQVLIEAFNIIKNVASDTLYKEWMHQDIRRYPLRGERQGEVKVFLVDLEECKGFT